MQCHAGSGILELWLTCRVVGHVAPHGVGWALGVYHAGHAVDSLPIGRSSAHHPALVHVGITRRPGGGKNKQRHSLHISSTGAVPPEEAALLKEPKKDMEK